MTASIVEPAGSREWPVLGKIGFRFLCAYLVLDGLMFPLGWLPFGLTRAIGQWDLDVEAALSRWTQIHLLDITSPLPFAFTGSSDTTMSYVMALNLVLLAIPITVIWTLLDRRRPNYSRLNQWLRTWVCLHLATIIFGYGFSKVIPSQFPSPELERYIQPLGEFSPMGLLWTFMGHSPSYNLFTGLIEVFGGVLLLFRRTRTLGALILIMVMSNVAMLNMSYDVPVKRFAIQLILMCVYVAAPDLRRLFGALVRNRGFAPRVEEPLFATRRIRYLAGATTALFMGYIAWSDVSDSRETVHDIAVGAASPLYGIYDVEDFRKNGNAMPPLVSDSLQWRRVVFGSDSRMMFRTMSDSVTRYRMQVDTVKHSLALTGWSDRTLKLAVGFEHPDRDHLVLRMLANGDSIAVRLRRVDEKQYLLLRRGFNWVQEKPFNR